MFRKILGILIVFLMLVGIGVTAVFFWYQSGGLQKTIIDKLGNSFLPPSTSVTSTSFDTQSALQQILGFDKEKIYLFLFLNNTELRPGGGFIGVYAVVRVKNGKSEILKVEGTEILDNIASRDFISTPPKPMADYLGIKRQEFRDSNWSPDFAISSQKSLELYKLENGIYYDKIDAVIGITPTVIEQILKIIGPIEHQGITYTTDNFTEKLEYEVEYGFAKKNIHFDDRKKIMVGLTKELAKKLTVDVFLKWPRYSSLAQDLINQKHILAYTTDNKAQKILESRKIAGRVEQVKGDFVMWVDANLGALKTDAYLDRQLSYSFKPDKGKYLATVKMQYKHNGVFDWRSTRYRTYARVYLPKGSELVSLKGAKNSKVDKGEEFNKQWFGAFAVIEPSTTGELEWQFYLAESIVKQIQNGNYDLLVQKQLGATNEKVLLDLDFGARVVSGSPAEQKKNHNDNRYSYSTKLDVDEKFSVRLK